MPELPEVETLRRDLERVAIGKTISHAEFLWAKSPHSTTPRKFNEQIKNQKIIAVNRRAKILNFELGNNLKIELHNEKTKVIQLKKGINFLGFRNFYYYNILKNNKRKLLKNKLNLILKEYKKTKSYNKFIQKIEAIFAHIEIANTFNLRKNLVNSLT
mgnify:CR=1 FL=1